MYVHLYLIQVGTSHWAKMNEWYLGVRRSGTLYTLCCCPQHRCEQTKRVLNLVLHEPQLFVFSVLSENPI